MAWHADVIGECSLVEVVLSSCKVNCLRRLMACTNAIDIEHDRNCIDVVQDMTETAFMRNLNNIIMVSKRV